MAVFCFFERDLGESIHRCSIRTRTRHREAWIRRQNLNLPTYNAADEPAGIETDDKIVDDESQTPPSPQNEQNEPLDYDSNIDISDGIDFERGKLKLTLR